MRAVAVAGGTLAVDDRGTGPAVLLLHGSVIADSMRPLADELCRPGDRRVVRPHRRGYGASTAPTTASIGIEAEDQHAVLDTLGLDRVDVVGWSHGGTVALELARRHPHRVRSLALLEPALLGGPAAAGLVAAVLPASLAWSQGRRTEAVDLLQTVLWGPDWSARLESVLPGAARDAARDLDAVFGSDLPAHQLAAPEPGAAASAIGGGRVLYVGGTAGGPLYDEIRDVVADRVPDATFVTLDGADHSFAVTRAVDVATALTMFLRTVSPVPERVGN